MSKLIITGATGTVARALARQLNDRHVIVGLSRNLEEIDREIYDEVYTADLLEEKGLETLRAVLADADAVFHLAWNIAEENFDTGTKWEGNLEMFRKVLDVAEESGVPRFINGSSIHAGTRRIHAYNDNLEDLEETPEPYRSSIDPEDDYELKEEDPEKLLDPYDEDPDSPYGHSKIETEHVLKERVRISESLKQGVSVRLGGVNAEDDTKLEGEPYYPTLRFSHQDLGDLVEAILNSDLEELSGYHQIYGVSDNPGRIFSLENPFGWKSSSQSV